MVPGIEVLGVAGAQILANLGASSVKGMLKRRKEKKRELEDAESSDQPVAVTGRELEEPKKLDAAPRTAGTVGAAPAGRACRQCPIGLGGKRSKL